MVGILRVHKVIRVANDLISLRMTKFWVIDFVLGRRAE